MKDEKENLKENVEVPVPCAGVKKPTEPGEGVGKWECVAGEWVWKRELGGV